MNTDVVDAPVAAAATAAPTLTVLCVDDEPNILSALKRALRPPGYRVLTAEGGAQALQLMETQTVDLIVSDMRMPGMDGAQLLEQARGRWPETVRVLLTGHADMSATVAAINRGRIFRYLSKPWDDTELQAVVRQGLELRALEQDKRRLEALTQAQNLELRDANTLLEQRVQARTADLSNANDKLKRSYMSSIKVFAGLLELRAGRLSGHGRRVADTARQIARAMELPADDVQQIFVAGLLHDIGLIGGSDVLLNKPYSRYDPAELTQYQRHAVVGEQALIALDDMQGVAAIIRAHHERFDGSGFPDRLCGNAIPIGARILAVADMFDDMQSGHLAETTLTPAETRTLMRLGRGSQYDPEVLDVFLHISEPQRAKSRAEVLMGSADLEAEMVLARDLVSTTGVVMLTAGHVLSTALIARVRQFEAREGGSLKIYVRPRTAS